MAFWLFNVVLLNFSLSDALSLLLSRVKIIEHILLTQCTVHLKLIMSDFKSFFLSSCTTSLASMYMLTNRLCSNLKPSTSSLSLPYAGVLIECFINILCQSCFTIWFQVSPHLPGFLSFLFHLPGLPSPVGNIIISTSLTKDCLPWIKVTQKNHAFHCFYWHSFEY